MHQFDHGELEAYLQAHAEVYHQEYLESTAKMRCRLPRYLVRHVEQDGGEIRMIAGKSLSAPNVADENSLELE